MSFSNCARLSFCVAVLVAIATLRASHAQELRERRPPGMLEADRDAFTPATTLVGRGWSLLEMAHAFIDNKRGPETNSFPESLYRYGLTEWLELRVGWNWEAGAGGNTVTANESSEGLVDGEHDVEFESYMLYGMKVACTKQQGWIPDSCWIVEGFTPTAGKDTPTKPVITYTGGWKFERGWELDWAMRFAIGNEEEHGVFNRWSPSAVLRYTPTEKLQVHLEYFGTYSDGLHVETSRTFLSPGGRFLVTPNMELGFRFGWGLSDDAANFFANTGAAWRF